MTGTRLSFRSGPILWPSIALTDVQSTVSTPEALVARGTRIDWPLSTVPRPPSLDAPGMLPVKVISLMDICTPILWLVNELTGGYLNRRRVRVHVHTAYVRNGNPTPYYFVNVTNTSSTRDVEVTHAWFATNPPVHILNSHRPLPVRLQHDEPWETCIEVARLPDVPGMDRLGRVRLSSGDTVHSTANRNLPSQGFVAGPPLSHRARRRMTREDDWDG